MARRSIQDARLWFVAIASSAALAVALAPLPVHAQDAARTALTEAEAEVALDTLVRRMDHYALREVTPRVVAALSDHRAALIDHRDPEAFRQAVNAVLLDASGDKHLSLWIQPAAAGPDAVPVSPEDMERSRNYGIETVQRLPGNIGYLRLGHFSGAPGVAEAMDRAFGLLSSTDALIIDVRGNPGGGPAAEGRLMAHLFARPVELGAILWRQCAPPPPERPDACTQVEPQLERRWSDTLATAPLYADKPVFVLTSSETFSAAEALAYDLRQEDRAVMVGETTKGGGNPGGMMDAGPRFSVIMPTGVGRHPKTGTSFEGVGVAPDVPAPAADALKVAHRLALEAAALNPAATDERAHVLAEMAPAG